MVELARFADILPQLGILEKLGGDPELREQKSGALRSERPDTTDTLALSGARPEVAEPASGPERPVAVGQDGTYRPTSVQVGRRMGFGFEFNLSIERQVTAVRRSAGDGGGRASALRAMESSAMAYQSDRLAYREVLGSSFREMRQAQTELFFSRTREMELRLDSETGERFGETSRRVARTFELSISLEVSFLSQFVSQSDQISDVDKDLFEQYLNHTDDLANVSGEAVSGFFGQVGRILDETEGLLRETLAGFFDDVAETFGLSEREAGALESMVVSEISSFFDDLDGFLGGMRGSGMSAIGEDGPSSEGQPEALPAGDETPVGETDPDLV